MISSILALTVHVAAPLPAAQPAVLVSQEEADEYQTKLEAAGEDVAKLWELQAWCKEQGRNSDRRKVLQKIVKADENHKDARKALGHHFYADRWFSTRTELSAYRRKEEREMAAKGLVRFGDEWVSKDDAPFMRMGWSKDSSGKWASPSEVAAAARKAQMEADGHQEQQVGVWIHPDEFDKWREGLWKCGEEWLDKESANAYHASLTNPWRIKGEKGHFVLVSPASLDAVWTAAWWADNTFDDLVNLFGIRPQKQLPVYMMDSMEMYNMVAAGSQEQGIPGLEGNNGWSACHYAFFADRYFSMSGDSPEFVGGGVCYYDYDDEGLKAYGQHAVRHAAALSYLDAIDPSWDTISRFIEAAASGGAGGGQGGGDNFWGEKTLPLWLRFGAASYVERYFLDASSENQDWPKAWSIQNLGGKLRSMEALFAFPLDANQPEASRHLLNEAGLVVCYIARGGNEAVNAAHAELKARLSAGEDLAPAIEGLQKALIENEAALREWAGLPAEAATATPAAGGGEGAGQR